MLWCRLNATYIYMSNCDFILMKTRPKWNEIRKVVKEASVLYIYISVRPRESEPVHRLIEKMKTTGSNSIGTPTHEGRVYTVKTITKKEAFTTRITTFTTTVSSREKRRISGSKKNARGCCEKCRGASRTVRISHFSSFCLI